jgi:hypothetical protein
MPPLAIALGGSALLGAGTSVASSIIGADAAGNAANAQLQGTRESIAAQKEAAAKAEGFLREQSGIARQDLEPFRQSQLAALGQANALTDPNNPVYSAERSQMTQAVQRQLAAQGLLRSKKQVDLLGNLELGIEQQRIGQINALAGNGAAQAQAGISQNLGGGLAGLQGQLGQQLGSSFQQLGQIQGQNALAQGQALSQGLVGVGNAIQGGVGSIIGYNNQQSQLALLQKYLGGK